jgi:hypothetical protein
MNHILFYSATLLRNIPSFVLSLVHFSSMLCLRGFGTPSSLAGLCADSDPAGFTAVVGLEGGGGAGSVGFAGESEEDEKRRHIVLWG